MTLRLVITVGTLLIVLIVPVIALLMFFGLWLAKWLLLPVAVIVLIAFASLWRAGVLLLRCAPERDGSIFAIKLVSFVFLGMLVWQLLAEGRFNVEMASTLFKIVEAIFLSLAMVYLSLALASRTRIPLSAWLAIVCSLVGFAPVLYGGLQDFGFI